MGCDAASVSHPQYKNSAPGVVFAAEFYYNRNKSARSTARQEDTGGTRMGTFNVSLKTLTDRVSMEVVYTPRALDEISV